MDGFFGRENRAWQNGRNLPNWNSGGAERRTQKAPLWAVQRRIIERANARPTNNRAGEGTPKNPAMYFTKRGFGERAVSGNR